MVKRKLTPKQAMFVKEYQVDFNATAAATRAGYSIKNAFKMGSELLQKTGVQEEISKLIKKRSDKVGIRAEDVLRNWVDIATADPAELVRPRRGCCPWCWGDSSSDPARAPNPDCTNCKGEGVLDIYIADINEISPKARKLYAGAKVKSDGSIEIKFRDQDRALENVAKHLGMFLEHNNGESLSKLDEFLDVVNKRFKQDD